MIQVETGLLRPDELMREGRYGSDEWLAGYMPYEVERDRLGAMWDGIRQRYVDGESGEGRLWQVYERLATEWMRGQLRLFLGEFGMGELPLQPSYWFEVEKGKEGIEVRPLNMAEVDDLSGSFEDYDERVGEGLRRVYERLVDLDVDQGMMHVSGQELYAKLKSTTDVLVYYRVVDKGEEKVIVEGKYVLMKRVMSDDERAFVHNWNASGGVLSRTDKVLGRDGGFVEVTAENMIQNPPTIEYGPGARGIEQKMDRLGEAYLRMFGKDFISPTDKEMYRLIEGLVSEYVVGVRDALLNGNEVGYYEALRNVLFRAQVMWAERNREDVDPYAHLLEVIFGVFPMVFAHPTNGENLWLYGDPIADVWFGGDACGGREAVKCKDCGGKKKRGKCEGCDKRKKN